MVIGGLGADGAGSYPQPHGDMAAMAEKSTGESETRDHIRRCLQGDTQAIAEFQETYGELVYGYPMRVYRMPREEAGDFYVFAFEGGRIFRRAQSFEGRTQFRTYLLGFVLDNLVLEWKRSEREIETVPIDSLSELPDTGWPNAGLDALPHQPEHGGGAESVDHLLADLEPSKVVLFKLLYIEDCELTPADLRFLKKASGRRMPELLRTIDHLRSIVRQREAGLKRLEDGLEAVHAWMQLYQRRMRRLIDDLAALPPNSSAAASLREEQAELQRKLEWRQRQRTNLLERAQRRKVTAPYKEIAALLHTSVGNIASQILRLRKELAARSGGRFRMSESEVENGDSDV